MNHELDFRPSRDLSMGVELELQILNSHDYNLSRDAVDLLALLEKIGHPGAIKPEITESMIELNSSVHSNYEALLVELRQIRDTVVRAAAQLNLRIAGGGSHPFHDWSERRIYPTERFRHLLEVYGYLAKQFTVFGQHIHIGCPDGDAALYLTHILSRYVPHFIALSASSPFQQGTDTGFQSSRLNTVSAFPLSGSMPFLQKWDNFVAYFEKMRGFHIVESMKDFYWDVRPKPDYGTVEIRVLDTPLTVERAALLAAYAQTLAYYALVKRPLQVSEDMYLVYKYNRFQACRYGFDANYADVHARRQISLQRDILGTLELLSPYSARLNTRKALDVLHADASMRRGDAAWLREAHRKFGSLNDVARCQSEEWAGRHTLISAQA
ncbi:MAG TPA: YbdK family carboxylate-amine ligase [Burkholderiales bacterium]|nr:YbdK family carboxylate-amine ligase [Burkholderiales bacterium]